MQSFELIMILSGHFTKDCFSAPGLQYALLPEEDDDEPRQQQTPSVAPQQDSEKKKKKKKVTVWQLMSQEVIASFFCVCLALSDCESLMQQPTHIRSEWQYMSGWFTQRDTGGLHENCQKSC